MKIQLLIIIFNKKKDYATISIFGRKTPDGHYYYRGTIIDLVETGSWYTVFINNNIGIMMPDQEYNHGYLGPDEGEEYEY